MPVNGTMNTAQAASLYANTAKTAVSGEGMNVGASEGPSFASILREGGEQAISTMKEGERMSAKAIIGDADLTDVVQAVTAAEVTLQTVTAVRDRMISAYQEIMRMPI